jgi:OOP family OmpA-OmpF porin
MNSNKIKTIVLTVTMALAGVTQAQHTKSKTNKWAIGAKLSNYYDLEVGYFDKLNNGFSGKDLKGLNGNRTHVDLGYGFDVAYFWTPVISVDLGFEKGNMTGANKVENYEAVVNFIQMGLNFDIKTKFRTKPYTWVPFLRASIGRSGFDSKRYFIEDDGLFNSESGSTMVSGLGLGLRYHFNDNFHALIQSEYTVVYSDGLDGYNYGSGKDHLLKTSLAIRYTFGKHAHNDRGLAWQSGASKDYDDIIKQLNDSLRIERARVNKTNDDIAIINQKLTEDTDGDGVPDIKDHCPTIMGNDKDGCLKEVLEVIPSNSGNASSTPSAKPGLSNSKQLELEPLIKEIYYEPGQYQINRKEDKERLARLGKFLASNPEIAISIVGFADGTGAPKENTILSEERAKVVYQILINNGASKENIEYRGLGSIGKHASKEDRKVKFLLQ